MPETDLQQFAAVFTDVSAGALPGADVRTAAWKVVEQAGVPTRRLEAWKHTDIGPLFSHTFGRAKAPAQPTPVAAMDGWATAIVENGVVVRFQNTDALPEGAHLCSLEEALRRDIPEAHELFETSAIDERDGGRFFTALNSALWENGVFLHVPKTTRAPVRLRVIYRHSTGTALQAHPKLFIRASAGTNVSLFEHLLDDTPHFTNVHRVLQIEKGAHVDHIVLQDRSVDGFHVSNTSVDLHGDSRYRSVRYDLGGAIARNNTTVRMHAPGAESELFGLYLPTGDQHIDNHTTFDHAAAHCQSNELFKGVLQDASSAVFNGRIIVRPGAQKTNAYQKNKNLLLSRSAHVNTQPQLEIYADDVRCTHGATIGQIDERAVFYLQSRGLSETQARALLRHAFIREIIQTVRDARVQAIVAERVAKRLAIEE